MLAPGQSPFPNNPVCKRCITKPCHRLFAGRVYAGKMIFVHHSEWKMLPCYDPQLKKPAVDYNEQPALTDDIEVIGGNIEITNPRWELIDNGDDESPGQCSRDVARYVSTGDTVKLMADVKNYPNGAPVSFDIYDTSSNPPLRIATVRGTNDNGVAKSEWTVEDPQQRKDAMPWRLAFEAGARSKYTPKADLPWQDKIRCDFVEIPDVLFHHNSAVPCLDENGMLLWAMAAAFMFAKENSGKEIVIFGHADTLGDPAYNYDLSQWRAEGIKALLDNDLDAWLDIVDLASKVEDYQTILKGLAASDWSCDPETVDNADGPKTKAAIKAFQEKYNTRYKGDLKPDGTIGPKTWRALFVAMRSIIENAVAAETGETALPELTYGYGGKGIYACGESFPVDEADKDNYQSATNRRVEMVFFDKGKAPKLTAPADKKRVDKKEAPVYDPRKTEKKKISVAAAEADSDKISDNDLVLYHPSAEQYIVIDQNDIKALLDEVKFCGAVADKIATVRKEISTEKDPVICASKARELEKEVAKALDLPDGYTTGVIDELVVVNGKHKAWGKMPSLIFVRSYVRKNGLKVKGHPRRNNDATVKKKFDEWCRSEFIDASMKNILLRTKSINENWPDVWKFNGNQSAKAKKDGDFWSTEAEASWLRFTAGAMVSTNLNLREFTFSLQGQGFVKYDLVSGTAKGSLLLPDKDGFDIFQHLGLNEKGLGVVKDKRQCRFMIQIDLHGFAMVTASASAAVGIPNIDLSVLVGKKSKGVDANVSAQGDTFAGATAGAGLKPSLQWSRDTMNFTSLAEIDPKIEGSAGAGIGIRITYGISEGKWRIAFGARFVVGLGARATVEVEIGLDEGYKLVAHILDSVDYHYVAHISSDAFKTFRDYSFAQFRKVGEVAGGAATSIMSEISDFDKWLKTVSQNSDVFKNIKSTIYKAVSDPVKLRQSPPETSGGMLLRTIMTTTDEADFEAILKVLESARGEHELKWILRRLMNDTIKDDPDGKWLQEGIGRVASFGRELNAYKPYYERLKEILSANKIITR